MNLHKRLDKLEDKAGFKKGVVVIRCIHPDDWNGELGPGCYRNSESRNVKAPPNTKVVYEFNFGFCMRTKENFYRDKPMVRGKKGAE